MMRFTSLDDSARGLPRPAGRQRRGRRRRARPPGHADQAARQPRPAGGARRLAGPLAGPRHAAAGQGRGHRLRRLARRHRAGRVGLSGRGDGADGRQFRRRRRRHQPARPRRPAPSSRSCRWRSSAPTADFTHRAGDGRRRTSSPRSRPATMRSPADADLLCLGEMGIGNTTAAAALAAALFGGAGSDWVGRGTGVDDAGLARKAAAVDAAISASRRGARPIRSARSPRVGGRELAAIFGATLAARQHGIPLLLDGFVCTAAAAPLAKAARAGPGACAGRPCLGRGRASPAARRLALEAAARSRHAARRRLRRLPRDQHRALGARLPHRHGELRRGRRFGEVEPRQPERLFSLPPQFARNAGRNSVRLAGYLRMRVAAR